jgi:hypothetical protein
MIIALRRMVSMPKEGVILAWRARKNCKSHGSLNLVNFILPTEGEWFLEGGGGFSGEGELLWMSGSQPLPRVN